MPGVDQSRRLPIGLGSARDTRWRRHNGTGTAPRLNSKKRRQPFSLTLATPDNGSVYPVFELDRMRFLAGRRSARENHYRLAAIRSGQGGRNPLGRKPVRSKENAAVPVRGAQPATAGLAACCWIQPAATLQRGTTCRATQVFRCDDKIATQVALVRAAWSLASRLARLKNARLATMAFFNGRLAHAEWAHHAKGVQRLGVADRFQHPGRKDVGHGPADRVVGVIVQG